jgi:hypothetical protein
VSLLNDISISVKPGLEDVRKTFRTGVAGRPSSKHIVMRMAEQRLASAGPPESWPALSEELARDLKRYHPDAPPMTAKTIRNALQKEGFMRKYPK